MSRMVPRGHEVAGLGRRVGAYLIDVIPVAVLSAAATWAMRLWEGPTVALVAGVGGLVLILAYGLYQWWAYASRGAGIGARLLGVELLGLADGRPVGWWKVFLRFLVWVGLWITVVGGIAMLVFLVIHERRQGWHDMAVGAVLVQPKAGAEPVRRGNATQRRTQTSTVGLPPHLAEAFSPEASAKWGPRDEQPAEPVDPQGQAGWQPPTSQSSFPGSQPSFPGSQSSAPGFQASAPGPMGQPSGPQAEPVAPSHPPQPGWIPMPTPSSVLEPSQRQVKVRSREFGEVEEEQGTTIAPLAGAGSGRPGDEGWYLRLDDGREVDLTVTVLLGRNPQRSEGDPETHLVPASGDGRTISRTHVLIGTDPRGVFVVDRGSTNGTALVTPTGGLEPAPAGVQVRVREGQQVSYGDRWFTVLRRPAQLG